MNNRLGKMSLGKVGKWLVDEAGKVGIDIRGFEHEITNEFVNHVVKKHGNEKAEAFRGQIAVKQDDFDKISEVINSPDLVMVGVKTLGRDMVAYAKKMPDGTTLYIEEVLSGKRNKTLRGKTMFKHKNMPDEKVFYRIISNGNGVDMTNTKILAMGRRGQSGDPTIEESVAVADTASAHKPGETAGR